MSSEYLKVKLELLKTASIIRFFFQKIISSKIYFFYFFIKIHFK